MARQVRNKKTTKKEQINHPSHYNSHPSKIECIEMIRRFDFNLGSSFKYLYRRDEKENLIQDIKKALWYVQDELKIRNAQKGVYCFFARLLNIPNLFKYVEYRKRSKLVSNVVSHETNSFTPIIYHCLNDADYYIYDMSDLKTVEKYLKYMIEEIEGKNNKIQQNV